MRDCMHKNKILTLREKEVFDLLAKNIDTEDIADRLCITPKTVRNHISNVIQKLGVRSRTQAIIELIKMNEINIH
ncbi:MAG: helix-turn-helix transcriptional regulator [Bacilli bacterium]|nr:helix-turn-helix transcriptional regulator [Bacilli bacterium]